MYFFGGRNYKGGFNLWISVWTLVFFSWVISNSWITRCKHWILGAGRGGAGNGLPDEAFPPNHCTDLHLRPVDERATNPIPAHPPTLLPTYPPLFVSPQKFYVFLIKSLPLGETSLSPQPIQVKHLPLGKPLLVTKPLFESSMEQRFSQIPLFGELIVKWFMGIVILIDYWTNEYSIMCSKYTNIVEHIKHSIVKCYKITR